MPAGLHFACAPLVGGLDTEAVKGVAARHELVVGQDGAELEREDVERSAELVRSDDQRRVESAVLPVLHVPGARAQIVGREGIHHRERMRRGGPVIGAMGRACIVGVVSGRLRAEAVNDHRLETVTEDGAEIAFERSDRVRNVHETHCIECGLCVCAS